MMLLRFAIIAVYFLIASYAPAQGVLLIAGSAGQEAPDGTTVLSVGTTSASPGGQQVIPRYRTGSTFPAGQVIGWGAASILSATAATDDIAEYPSVVITEDYGEDMSQWQTTTGGTVAAVLQPRLMDCTVIGYAASGWGGGGEPVNDNPEIWNQDDEDLYAGALLKGGGGTVQNVTFYGIPGTALVAFREDTELGGAQLPHDRVKWNVRDTNFRRVFRGLDYGTTDGYLENSECESFRDYGYRLSGNAIQFEKLHAYGGGMSAALNTTLAGIDATAGTTGIDSPGIWISGSVNQGTLCYSENCPVGVRISGNHNTIDGLYCHTNSIANIIFAGTQNKVSKAKLEVETGTVGVEFDNQYNTLTDSSMQVEGSSKGISIDNGTGQVIRNVILSCTTSGGDAIDVNATLTNCTIDVVVYSGDVAIDFSGGGIGAGNFIRVNTTGPPATVATLPANWNTTPNTTTTSLVYINGVQYFYNP